MKKLLIIAFTILMSNSFAGQSCKVKKPCQYAKLEQQGKCITEVEYRRSKGSGFEIVVKSKSDTEIEEIKVLPAQLCSQGVCADELETQTSINLSIKGTSRILLDGSYLFFLDCGY